MKKVVAVAFVALLAMPFVAQAASPAGFEVFMGGAQRLNQTHYFRLRALNGKVVLQSEAYTTKAGAFGGIASILRTGVTGAKIAFSKNGGYYFNLKALNFRVTASSEVYKSKFNAQRALASIQRLIDLVRGKTMKQLAAAQQQR